MKSMKYLIWVMAFLLVMAFPFNSWGQMTDFRDGDYPGLWQAPPEMKYGTEKAHQRKALLDPGMGTFCEPEFVVENMGEGHGELAIVAGGFQTNEEIQPKSVQSYNLRSGGTDEARIFNEGEEPIRVECK